MTTICLIGLRCFYLGGGGGRADKQLAVCIRKFRVLGLGFLCIFELRVLFLSILEVLLRAGDVEFCSDYFILRLWTEVKGHLRFKSRNPRVREKKYPVGRGSKTIHNFLLKQRQQKAWSLKRVRAIPRMSTHFLRKAPSARGWEAAAAAKLRSYG